MDDSIGLIHLYHGDGKGKTTAAAGLALRALGNNRQVVFLQFLKDGTSGEIAMLHRLAELPGVRLTLMNTDTRGFTFTLTPAQRAELLTRQNAALAEAAHLCQTGQCDLLVLDEVLHAVNQQLLELPLLLALLDNRPTGLEVVLTGRNPIPELVERADYSTEMRKQKHPYDRGIAARQGVEW